MGGYDGRGVGSIKSAAPLPLPSTEPSMMAGGGRGGARRRARVKGRFARATAAMGERPLVVSGHRWQGRRHGEGARRGVTAQSGRWERGVEDTSEQRDVVSPRDAQWIRRETRAESRNFTQWSEPGQPERHRGRAGRIRISQLRSDVTARGELKQGAQERSRPALPSATHTPSDTAEG
jgi:hypothetical protein